MCIRDRTSVKLTAFLAAACVAAGGISSPAALAQAGKAAVEIDDAQVPLYSKPAGSYVRTPIASGTTTYKNEKATLDASNVSEGYIMVKYTGSVGKIKIQITKSGSETYTSVSYTHLVKLMNFHFSEEEISLIKDLIETSYACTLGGKELTYGEKLEKLLSYHG